MCIHPGLLSSTHCSRVVYCLQVYTDVHDVHIYIYIHMNFGEALVQMTITSNSSAYLHDGKNAYIKRKVMIVWNVQTHVECRCTYTSKFQCFERFSQL